MVRHIIFDVDGTLLDSCMSINAALARTARELTGREVPLSLAAEAFSLHSQAALRHVGVAEEDIEQGLLLFDRYSYREGIGSAPFPGVTALLEGLQAAGRPMSVFSARSEDEFDNDPSFRPLKRYFRRLMGVHYSGRPKPAPDGLLRFLREESLGAGEVLLVGDAATDSLSAAGAGIPFALAGWNGAVDPSAVPHDFLLRAPEELWALFG